MPRTDLRGCLSRILSEYSQAREQAFSSHVLADFIRKATPSIVEEYLEDPSRYICDASPGSGNWASTPWIAIFDKLITSSAQCGYYPVYLFRNDCSGVYLSLNQGVTDIKNKYHSNARRALRTRAVDFISRIGKPPPAFPLTEIDLGSNASGLSADYEAGNICAVFYKSNELPSDEQLAAHLAALLEVYDQLSYGETITIGTAEVEADEIGNKFYEDARVLRQHKRIERNKTLSQEVKRVQGTRCKACGLRLTNVYGLLGKGYIEAHHLVPVSQLRGKKVLLDPRKDFTVLCANCHRMIHRTEYLHDVEAFREKYVTPHIPARHQGKQRRRGQP
jgi:5-methylcytosine-specific restriction protein A